MKFKSFCIVLTTIFTLNCGTASAQPDGPGHPKNSDTEQLQVNSITELYDLVARTREDSTLSISQEWIQKEYNRLVREMDEAYHPQGQKDAQATQPAKAVSQSRPSEYNATVWEG